MSQPALTRSPSLTHPLETILAIGLKRLVQFGIPLTIAALLMPAPAPEEGLFGYVLVHLAIIQLITFAYAVEASPALDTPWFEERRRSWLASAASLIAAGVGMSALLTLATSAAARYDVSLQFLQLLSSLDIAWVVAAMYLGATTLWGRRTGTAAGLVLLAACVASIAIYLAVVGFETDGGWLVDGAELLRIVIPSDVMAAVASISVLWIAGRRSS